MVIVSSCPLPSKVQGSGVYQGLNRTPRMAHSMPVSEQPCSSCSLLEVYHIITVTNRMPLHYVTTLRRPKPMKPESQRLPVIERDQILCKARSYKRSTCNQCQFLTARDSLCPRIYSLHRISPAECSPSTLQAIFKNKAQWFHWRHLSEVDYHWTITACNVHFSHLAFGLGEQGSGHEV